jgi:hypothetical protein
MVNRKKSRTSNEVRASHPFPIQGPEKVARSPRPPRVDQVGGVRNNWYLFGPSFPACRGHEKAISYIREALLTIATYAALAIASRGKTTSPLSTATKKERLLFKHFSLNRNSKSQ